MGEFTLTENGFIYRYDFETVMVTACGNNSVRVQAAYGHKLPQVAGAIGEGVLTSTPVTVCKEGGGALLKNGRIEVRMTDYGFLSFYKEGELVLKEYMRSFLTGEEEYRSPLRIYAREYTPCGGGRCKLTARFTCVNEEERIYGMGQYQHPFLNLKGMELELAHRNTQASVPFYVSSLGYGFLWNQPATGSVFFGKERTTWSAELCAGLDYWVTVGGYKEMATQYCEVTGFPSPLPEYAAGFWQCKLRYSSEEEVLSVAREYKKRGLPLSVIVIDFFHWKHQGDWAFDEAFWKDPARMVKELESMGVRVAVSLWPTVESASENYAEMINKGYLMNTVTGKRLGLDVVADTAFVDFTNPEACAYFWGKVKNNYFEKGIRSFWLDVAEPEYAFVNPKNFSYSTGLAAETGNVYPREYSKTVYEGLRASGEKNVLNLVRCAWAGSQKYGALVWSGDVNSSFRAMRNQLQAGLNIGLAGIPWWTMDIGGFNGGDVRDPQFKELLIRWFEWGTFCPVMRLHGDRAPRKEWKEGEPFASGADNEVWSYGEEAYRIFKKYLALREKIRPYVMQCAREAEQFGYPVMRTLFFEFPEEKEAYLHEDEYLLGSSLLVAPIFEEGARERRVYLPYGARWKSVQSGEVFEGGNASVPAPLDEIPLFVREGSSLEKIL